MTVWFPPLLVKLTSKLPPLGVPDTFTNSCPPPAMLSLSGLTVTLGSSVVIADQLSDASPILFRLSILNESLTLPPQVNDPEGGVTLRSGGCGVGVAVGTGVLVGVAVGIGVGVGVGVLVGVGVGVGVGFGVSVGVGVAVGGRGVGVGVPGPVVTVGGNGVRVGRGVGVRVGSGGRGVGVGVPGPVVTVGVCAKAVAVCAIDS